MATKFGPLKVGLRDDNIESRLLGNVDTAKRLSVYVDGDRTIELLAEIENVAPVCRIRLLAVPTGRNGNRAICLRTVLVNARSVN